MFDFNQGNPNLKFSAGASPSNTAPFTKPTQGQMGAGGGKEMMMLNMLSGMMNKGGNETAMHGGGIDYSGGTVPVAYSQRDPQQAAYQQAIMRALMNPGGGY